MKKKLLLSLLCGFFILGLTGCGSTTDDSTKYDINIDSSENIEVKTYVDYEKENLIIYLTNNNDYNIGSFDVYAKFYDENGNNILDNSTINFDFISGGDYVTTIFLPEDENRENYVPAKIDLSIKIDEEYQEIVGGGILYNDKIATSYIKSKDEIEVTVKNNSDVDLSSVEIIVLFMKKGKPIYADEIFKSLEAGESVVESIDIPEDWEASEDKEEDDLIDFDSIKLIVNRASDF